MPLSTNVKASTGAAGILALIAAITFGVNQFTSKPPKIGFLHITTGEETIETDLFKIYENGVGVKLEGVKCEAINATDWKCEAPVPAATVGSHFYSISVTNAKGEESPLSEAAEYRLDAVIKP